MLFQTHRFAGHKRLMMTLGVGAMALTIAACSSTAVDGDPTQGDPPPEPAPDGQNADDLLLGAPAGVGDSGGALPPLSGTITDGKRDESGATSGSTTEGVRGETAASIGIDPYYNCETGSSDPAVLFIEGEPVSVDPAHDGGIYDLEDYADSGSDDGDDVRTDRHVEDGISLGMPVPEFADVTEMIVEGVEAPEPVSAPPAILPTIEQIMPELISVPVVECDPGTVSTTNSGSSGSSSSTIEPVPYPGDELPVNIEIVEAPIESAGITIAESFPPQYFLRVVSGLPSSAATFGDYAVKRDGNIVSISMTNYVQTDVVAAQLYGIQETNIALGSEFKSGETYDVLINGRSWTKFTAQ